MQFFPIADWDDAYANADHIPGADAFIRSWPKDAAKFRKTLVKQGRAALDVAYGKGERNRLDLFYPETEPRGLAVFVHGGYWMRFDRTFWSHFAAGPLACGWVVAMPSYSLCPDVRILAITKEVASAIEFAAREIKGPIRLAGHSAGGHLVARMVCKASPLKKSVQNRIEKTVSISPVSDLRPLCRLKINDVLKLTASEAAKESPALLEPLPGADVTCWVGAAERSEFVRQNLLLAAAWHGLGAHVTHVEESDRHHFDVIDGLQDADSGLTRSFAG